MADSTLSQIAATAPTESVHNVARNQFLKALRRSPKGLAGLLLIGMILIGAAAAPALAPYDPAQQVLGWRFLPPVWATGGGWDHILGGDNLGRDIFSRIVVGARTSLAVAIIVVALAATIGSLLGAVAGYAGGIVDNLIMRLVDFLLAFPFLLLALMIMAILGPGFWTMVLALSIALWVNYARVVRGEALRIEQMEFVEAARSIGVPGWRIVLGHVLPNVIPSVLVLATLEVALVIIAEAALSFLGLGVQPPTPSWGKMISEGRDFLYDAPWMVLGPGLVILMTSVGINLFGDFLRDFVDPRAER
ncbi:ABC transporter permease [Mesorhizobium sp. 1M-11]|uniref:ABC transporter permease n=1 Tax=Mesorhizobium sp. 1M-11 TaxID=1529006 RepID=UPI0009E92AF9|nr:ABC transporter permease [Mesorhizobium sp. 1M-11]